MRIIRHPDKKSLKGSVVALGTFDGVHRGHQKVISQAVKYAKKIGSACLAITFDPHPQQFIVPERGLKLLTTLPEREELFCRYGMDGVVVIRFRKSLRDLSSEAFVKKYLVDKLGVKRVYVGFDYAFGRERKGSVAYLKQMGKRYDFEVSVVAPVRYDHHTVKSAMIRELLNNGDFNRAVRLLGHPYQLSGRVVKGRGHGKSLGFPTANLKLDPHKLIPLHGVYAGLVSGKKCAVNIGTRPTFGLGPLSVEIHVIDQRMDLRGMDIRVHLTGKIRDEKQFSDVEKLKAQIKKDIERIKFL